MCESGRQDIRGARILVVGLGVTGRACSRALPEFGAEVVVTDVREDLTGMGNVIAEIESNGARFVPLRDAASAGADMLVLSPGLAPDDPRVLPIRDSYPEWMSEIELGFRLSNGRILAITGSNGKTTVTTLAGRILAEWFSDTRVAGNIGDTFIEAVVGSGSETVFALEVSSYQLEGCSTFRPDVGIVLNVQADHLTRHRSMEFYAAAKARMLVNMGPADTAVLNMDDEYVREMKGVTRADVIFYSVDKDLDEGAFFNGEGRLVMRRRGLETGFGHSDGLRLRGRHNIGNVLAASAGTAILGAPPEIIRNAVSVFKGLEHRIETVGQARGVECVNDSKGTNPDAALAALGSFAGRDVTLLMGGDDKGFDYSALYDAVETAGARVIVIGTGVTRIAEEIVRGRNVDCRRAGSMREAVLMGLEITKPGGVLLLSPASSSFDMYKNYEERGRDFKNEVERAK